ncbi:hypothetical protein Pth03_46060 [Planotetraspora thailandica]|uniref:Maltokinase N-terminal cap domain-containing protein n=1 Tax=Planotetraspora thailandica TaxID=487172 RepID=A0A8J3V612_9ACTN|nr:1,4-alpha-glucan branching protein [Planotetraspora thailandica]GII56217.1 hypothetical protein Pth03_46060 [Planotetraspora thailandica]
MAVIHHTTLAPSKLELLTSWLPAQPWHLGDGREPELAKVGGFRLDDPEGEVGIEFMVVTDGSGDQPVTYQVLLSYRGAPLDGADHALVGTAEHGVLGRRWIYDGAHDLVVVGQLFALILGETKAQAQSVSDTPDPSVTGYSAEAGRTAAIESTTVNNGPHGTDLLVQVAETPGLRTRELTIQLRRVLQPNRGHETRALGHVTAGWLLPDGTKAQDMFAVLLDAASEPRS